MFGRSTFPAPRPICAEGLLLFRAAPSDGEAGWSVPRLPAGGVALLTTGRDMVRGGGMAVLRPLFAPSMLVRVGRASTARTAATWLNCCGVTRTALRATGRELTSVSRETAVNPLGTRILA